MILEGLKYIMNLRKWIMSALFTDEIHFSSKTFVKHSPGTEHAIIWKTIVPENTMIIEQLQKTCLDDVTLKYRVWYTDQEYESPTIEDVILMMETPITKPWIWIGGKSLDGDLKNATDELNKYLVNGNVIKQDLLDHIDNTILTWSYMNPETLELTDFPIDGIVIKSNDNSRVESSTKEVQTTTDKIAG